MKERLVVWVYYGDHHYLLLFQRGGSKSMGNQLLTGMKPQPCAMPYPKGGSMNLKNTWVLFILCFEVIQKPFDTHIYPFSIPKIFREKKQPAPNLQGQGHACLTRS